MLALLGLLFAVSSGIEGGMDSYNHFLIAKHSWQNPELFLDYWGKPIYNIVASPFTQFGLIGSFTLNTLCLVLCALLAYKIALILKFKWALLVYIFALLSPIFLDNTISSLTEPLCALLVVYTLYLLLKDKYIYGALVAGFLPFARSEGFIILFVVFVYLVVKRQKLTTFLYLAIGTIVFNTLGWIITGNPFWVIAENPYINFELSGRNVCGNGGIGHYFRAGHYTFGLVISILMTGSLTLYIYRIIKNDKNIDFKFGVVLLSFILYFASHAFIWWQGMMGSCGYERVMTAIAPLAAVIAVYFIEFLFQELSTRWGKKSTFIKKSIVFVLILNAFYVPFRYYAYKYPLTLSQEQEQYVKLNKWYNSSGLEGRTKLYLYPYFSIIANISPYNQAEHLELWSSSLQWTKKGDILIWDSHFGPNESNLPLEDLKQNQNWNLIKSIIPSIPIKTIKDANFEIHVFEKIAE